MKKNLTEMVFILDRSGSMHGLEADTIGGFNSMIDKQKQVEGDALVSAVLFSDESAVIYDRVDIRKIEPMTATQYSVSGCTALIDAIGGAIHHMGNVHKYAREEDVPEHTIFIITTDGLENASHRYTLSEVRKMVERQENRYGWEFLFLGANMDAIQAASGLGIRPERSVRYRSDKIGTALNYTVMEEAVRSLRCSGSVPDTWKDRIDEDYRARK
ncbi:MAG: VWA domain-containing protein [Clostridia bacterium]|nr:VWA domain-containing protein [Clostridia bacterium]